MNPRFLNHAPGHDEVAGEGGRGASLMAEACSINA